MPTFAVLLSLLLITLSVDLASAAPKAPRGSVIISSSTQADFIFVGRSKNDKVLCRFRNNPKGGIASGIVRKDLRTRRKVWRSFDKFINDTKKNLRLRSATRRKETSALKKLKTKFDAECLVRIAVTTPVPSATPTTGPAGSPTVPASPTSVGTPQTATFTPTPTQTSTPTATSTRTPTPTPTPTTPPPTTTQEVLIRCGSANAYVDQAGKTWQPDTGLFTGNTLVFTSPNPIGGTIDDPLYQTERNGTNFGYAIPLTNGTYDVVLHFAETFWTSSGSRVFSISLESAPVLQNLDIFAQAQGNVAISQQFSVAVNDGVLNIGLLSSVDRAKISGIELHNQHPGHPFLHVVIDGPSYVVDYDGNGTQNVQLDGTGSHTHQPGHALTAYRWFDGATPIGTTSTINPSLAVGAHNVRLEIEDSATTPPTLSDTALINVYPITAVGGTLADYFPAGATPLTTLIDALPSQPGYREILPSYTLFSNAANIGGSPYTGNLVARLSARVNITTAGTYEFVTQGGSASRVFIDATIANSPRVLTAGLHTLEVRFAVPSTAFVPAIVQYRLNGGALTNLSLQSISHNEATLAPFINSMPSSGASSGGQLITISGYGFFPTNSVVVHWGNSNLSGAALSSVSPGEITFINPGGVPGNINVTVQTPNGTSNVKTFTYSGSAPINFTSDAASMVATLSAPTQAAWGPDGRLYVGSFSGMITAYTFSDNYTVTNTQQIPVLTTSAAPSILGIAFNPFDPPTPVKIYVAHTLLFAHEGGACFTGSADYVGRVSVVQGPNFTTATPLITGLPTSNHDHGINGMQFDNYGDLLIAVGGSTNGGVFNCGPTCCNIGNIPETPLSAAVIKAQITKPGFNGAITYRLTSNGQPNNDQNFGELVDVAPGVDVSVFTPGLRNAFDILWSTHGQLYGVENGANVNFGAFSTSATTQVPEVDDLDEILLLTQGNYYGHPNRSRGRYDNRENIHRFTTESQILGVYSPPLGVLPASTDGIDEYRATTFNSAMRGDLLLQRFRFAPATADLYNAKLSADGRTLLNVNVLKANVSGLDVVSGPGGAVVTTDYVNNALKVYKPIDAGAAPMQAYDIFPWRGRSVGGQPFVIGGVGFSGQTTVTIGNLNATVTSVTPTRIRGVIPQQPSPTSAMLPVSVQSAGQTYLIPNAFRYVFNPGSGLGQWTTGAPLPTGLGEVAAGVINGILYIVGEDSNGTFAYDHFDGTWSGPLASRPFPGHHHGAEVINGKLYLIGGIGGGSERKLQVFTPQTNSWTSSNITTNVDWGSPSTAFINGMLYIAGGISGGTTHNQVLRFNPQNSTWLARTAMPVGRNHTAASTDGSKMYVFGGRDGGNVVGPGFNTVQIYDPVANTWESSTTPGSTLPPLPQARGGMGKAVYFNREFYVIGGETNSPSQQTYSRVDVFNPVSRTWRLDQPMPTARHGIFPLAFDGRIFVAAGGTQAGHSSSNILELLTR